MYACPSLTHAYSGKLVEGLTYVFEPHDSYSSESMSTQ